MPSAVRPRPSNNLKHFWHTTAAPVALGVSEKPPDHPMTTPADRVKAVFDQAAEIAPPADRAAFLDNACGGDAELRVRVEVLLRAHAEAGSFLEQPEQSTHRTGIPGYNG